MTARSAALVAAAVVAALCAGAVVAWFQGGPGITDIGVYERYGDRMTDGDVPYRDFAVEYPPGALLPFVLPALVTSGDEGFKAAFKGEMVLALVLCAVLVVIASRAVGASAERILFSVGAFLAGVMVLGPFILTRFDLYAAAVCLAALCAILHGRERLGSVLLGLAIATKIYPAVLLPLLFARIWRREGARAAWLSLGLTVATALAVYLPFALVAPEGVLHSVWRQLGRPLQIESLGSAVLLALHHAAGMPLDWASGSGSQNLTGTVAAVASAVTTVVGLAALVLVWARFARGETSDAGRFARYAAAATVAFVAFGKVSSPQFLVWLLAVVVVVPGLRGVIASLALFCACALTRGWFPNHYWELVKQFDTTSSWLVLIRDLVLVGIFGVLVVSTRSSSTARGSAEP